MQDNGTVVQRRAENNQNYDNDTHTNITRANQLTDQIGLLDNSRRHRILTSIKFDVTTRRAPRGQGIARSKRLILRLLRIIFGRATSNSNMTVVSTKIKISMAATRSKRISTIFHRRGLLGHNFIQGDARSKQTMISRTFRIGGLSFGTLRLSGIIVFGTICGRTRRSASFFRAPTKKINQHYRQGRGKLATAKSIKGLQFVRLGQMSRTTGRFGLNNTVIEENVHKAKIGIQRILRFFELYRRTQNERSVRALLLQRTTRGRLRKAEIVGTKRQGSTKDYIHINDNYNEAALRGTNRIIYHRDAHTETGTTHRRAVNRNVHATNVNTKTISKPLTIIHIIIIMTEATANSRINRNAIKGQINAISTPRMNNAHVVSKRKVRRPIGTRLFLVHLKGLGRLNTRLGRLQRTIAMLLGNFFGNIGIIGHILRNRHAHRQGRINTNALQRISANILRNDRRNLLIGLTTLTEKTTKHRNVFLLVLTIVLTTTTKLGRNAKGLPLTNLRDTGTNILQMSRGAGINHTILMTNLFARLDRGFLNNSITRRGKIGSKFLHKDDGQRQDNGDFLLIGIFVVEKDKDQDYDHDDEDLMSRIRNRADAAYLNTRRIGGVTRQDVFGVSLEGLGLLRVLNVNGLNFYRKSNAATAGLRIKRYLKGELFPRNIRLNRDLNTM